MPVRLRRSRSTKLLPASWAKIAMRRTAWLLLMIAVVTTTGCSGCNSKNAAQQASEEEEAEKKKKEAEENKKKAPIEIGPLLSQLGQDEAADPTIASGNPKEGSPILVKPGHWTPTVRRMKANYEDFVGRTSTGLFDRRNQPSVLRYTRYTYETTRPVLLAKGREKIITGELFVPEYTTGKRIHSRLFEQESGRETPTSPLPLQKMPSYQYFLVVLAKEASRYTYLKVTDAVRAPWEEELEETSSPHYRVVLADADRPLPLSTNSLAWTSISTLIWDEVDPSRMSAEQQTALLDWLHWGGRILINGPDSLDTLRGSFLDPYLPAESEGPRKFDASDLAAWSSLWARRSQGADLPPLVPKQPWSGIRLKPREGARELLGGAKLFFERNVGRGTVVVSAFQLAERDFINWPGYDCFLNSALLSRPRRRFSAGEYGGPRVTWQDFSPQRLDAHFITGLRLFARDTALKANWQRVATTSNNQFGVLDEIVTEKVDRPGGIAAWSEDSPVSLAAREALDEAAAVRIPSAGFVLTCLGLYLIVLVPLNWIVFRSMGRVEWAWIAAPVIALLGTWTLVRLVQLDIGFVRAHTEIALLELQGTYERGLLTRYTGLYSSLSTTYEIAYDEPTTMALPFPAKEKDVLKVGDRSSPVVFEKLRKTSLQGLTVSSASRRAVHSEQLVSLDGSLRLGTSSRGSTQIENRSGYNLRDVVVVRRTFVKGKEGDSLASQPQIMGSWVGELRNNGTAVLGPVPIDLAADRIPFEQERTQAALVSSTPRINVNALMKLAFQFPGDNDPRQKNREEVRLVGVIDHMLSGTKTTPMASQIRGATVVLAHLKYAAPPEPQPDVNSRPDVITEKPIPTNSTK